MIENKDEQINEGLLEKAKVPEKYNNTSKAVIAMMGYNITNFTYMAISKNIMLTGVRPFDLMFFRSLVSFTQNLIMTKCNGTEIIGDEIRNNATNRKTLLIRSIAGTIGFSCYVIAISKIPMAICMIIFNTGPFWAILLGCLINKDQPTCMEIACMLFSFVGIIMVSLSQI